MTSQVARLGCQHFAMYHHVHDRSWGTVRGSMLKNSFGQLENHRFKKTQPSKRQRTRAAFLFF